VALQGEELCIKPGVLGTDKILGYPKGHMAIWLV